MWLPVAIVAAVIGGAIGAGVMALSNNSNSDNGGVTIHESNAAPGAAVLSGNVTIPQLVNKVIHAVVSIDVKSGSSEDQGTGMIITSDGEVITNNHVIELYVQGGRTGSITVTEYGQTKALATSLIGYDESKDVALLKIDNGSGLPSVTFGNSSKAVVGDAVVAIGNALGLAAGTPTVTQGIVSARPFRHRRGIGLVDRDAAEHDPDRRRHQPRQLRRSAHRHLRSGHRDEHGCRRHLG
jgi:putative serine protease PepD